VITMARARFSEQRSNLAGRNTAQGRYFGGAAEEVAELVDRLPASVIRHLRSMVGVGEQTVGFPAALGPDLRGTAAGLEVVSQGGFDVFLAAEAGGVAGGFGVLGLAQGGRAG
jgi:hypothetical protein